MIQIKIATSFPGFPLLRQLPKASGYEFVVDTDEPECDWFVAFDGPYIAPVKVRCPPDRRLLVTTEPPPLRFYNTCYIEQFRAIYTCHVRLADRPGTQLRQQGLPWHIGAHADEPGVKPKMYSDFKAMRPEKQKQLSVICSNKTNTKGHRQRVTFVQELKNYFQDRIDVFGRGTREIPDKWDAIAPYQFHIALENSAFPHYWTEKLSDAYLGWAFPIYYGCPNIGEYFSADQLVVIDITDPKGAIETIERTIADGYANRIEAIRQARQLVLDRYNFFSLIVDHIQRASPTVLSPTEVVIRPNELCKGGVHRLAQSVWRRLPSGIKRLVK